MPAGTAKLEFSVNQETWVNVVDASGREIYSKTIYAGSRESIDVKPPVSVTVGNAGATSMSFNGKSVELAPHSRNNVAHIKLE
jgi:cytoskeleton protein RodZ